MTVSPQVFGARRRALFTSVGLAALALSTPAFAQDADDTVDEDALPTDAIVVTGSLIRNPNIQASAPVSVIGEDELKLAQIMVAEEALRELPGAVPSIGSNVNNGNGGASFVNLRGLGANRNIVLLDGRRIAPSGLSGIVDLNNIPVALVQRVDVLTGGASSTYGADAVTGVVNFITRQDFEGVELASSYELTEIGDGAYRRADLTVGANFDDGRGNATLSLGWQKSDPVYQDYKRPFSEEAIESYLEECLGCRGSTTTVPAAFDIGGGRPRQQVSPDGNDIVDFYQPFNFNPYNVFQTPFKRYNLFGSAHYDVSDSITVYGRGMYSNNTVETIIAPSGAFASTVVVPASNPFLKAAQLQYLCDNATITQSGTRGLTAAECTAASGATDPNDPNYRSFQFNLRRRAVEIGPRISDYNTQIFDMNVGVRGDITDNISFDVWGSYGQSSQVQTIKNYLLTSRLRDALLATNTTTCLSGNTDCVPLDIFGLEGSITPEMVSYLTANSTSTTDTSLAQVHGQITGDLFNLWSADPIGFAVGTEYRKYTAEQSSDLLAKTPGELGGAGGAAPDIYGAFDVVEGFAEVIAPIVTDRPFFHELQVEAGVRYSEYSIDAPSDPSFNTTTWKVAGSWAPIPDIRFRGNYAHAVRAPNINELFSPVSTGLTNLGIDPCAGAAPVNNANLRAVCIAQGAPASTIGTINNPTSAQANSTGGGNLNLLPEVADTWTAGVVLRPTFLPGFSATIDYYKIKVEKAITSPTPADAIAACFGSDPTNPPASAADSPACTIIRRNPQTGSLDGDPATTPGLFLTTSNLGRLSTAGVDVTANYTTGLGTVLNEPASISLGFAGNWTDYSKFQASPTSINRDCVGQYSANCGSIQPELSFSLRSTLSLGSVDVSLLWNYQSAADYEFQQLKDELAAAEAGNRDENGVLLPIDDQDCPNYESTDDAGCIVDPKFRRIPAYSYFDLSTRFNVTDTFTLTFTVKNLLDKAPPFVGNSVGSTAYNSGNTYPSSYDALGRSYAVAASLRF